MTHCFCLLGWHFFDDFYESLYRVEGKKYIICHREREQVERLPLWPKIQQDIFFAPNRGLEWGGYHQFVEMKLHEPYDFVVFLHDDVVIKDENFVAAVRAKFSDPGVKVVGNGRNGRYWEFRFAQYKERMFFEEADDFIVRTVRGSFFAARSEIFRTIGNFPVLWRAKKMTNGNVSLRNFGYVITKNFGRESIAYLADSHLETPYLAEMRRGQAVVAQEEEA